MFLKKIVSICLALMMLLTAFSTASYAADADMELSVMTYNVSGLPIAGASQGTNNSFTFIKAGIIGGFINDSGYDIVGVQEDFNFHALLARKITDYKNTTIHHGGVPYGDGLNIFSKYPIYNVERHPWRSAAGVFNDSSDELAQKGFVKTVVEIKDGVYVDLYVLHADAGRKEVSLNARADNFKQLCEQINADTSGRAVILMGDFNFMFYRNLSDDLYNNLLEPAGLCDVWVELYHGGDYTVDEGETPVLQERLDRILYKSGDGVTIEPSSLANIKYIDKDGKTCTDHLAVGATLAVTFDNPPQVTDVMNSESIDFLTEGKRRVEVIFSTLLLLLKNIPELF